MSEQRLPDPNALIQTLERNLAVIERNIEGIDQERSLLTVVPGGSHLNWLLGHLVVSRDSMLRSLGAEPMWDRDTGSAYRRGSSPALAPDARPMDELIAALRESQRRLVDALEQATSETLGVTEGDRRVGDWVSFLVWHESYHAGQTALYRRLAGLEGALG